MPREMRMTEELNKDRLSSGRPRASLATLLREADSHLPAYLEAVNGMTRETERKGICVSEMFFFYAVVKPMAPRQIIESGRARGESTLALARCFPGVPITSIEYR